MRREHPRGGQMNHRMDRSAAALGLVLWGLVVLVLAVILCGIGQAFLPTPKGPTIHLPTPSATRA